MGEKWLFSRCKDGVKVVGFKVCKMIRTIGY